METFEFESHSPDDTRRLGEALGKVLRPGDVVLLNGDLGVGKTQFAKGVLRGLDSASEAISPTFNIMLVYDDGRIPLVHMDLYRLESADQLEDIDFYALIDDGAPNATLIEWANLFPDDMPDDVLEVSISRGSLDGQMDLRRITIRASHPRGLELLNLLKESVLQ